MNYSNLKCVYYPFKSRKTGKWDISIGVQTFSLDKVPCYWWNKGIPTGLDSKIYDTIIGAKNYIFSQINEEIAELERNKDEIDQYIRKEAGEDND